jgi:sugar lactone lactonase YvrE
MQRKTLNQASLKTYAAIAAAAMMFVSGAAIARDITFHADQLYPESVTYSAKQRVFIVGSVRHGTVGRVTKEGRYTPFILDDRLVSTLGVLVDDKRNTLWVVNADTGAGDRTSDATRGKLAALAAYDATTGARRAYYDLSKLNPGVHLANDVVLDRDGNAYVTDSFAPIVYKVDVKGNAEIFAQDPRFKTGEGFNLNGIAWHSDGFLIVGNYQSGELFRISTKGPVTIERVQMSEALKGADGFHLLDSTHLIVVQNAGVDRTVELSSSDGWKTASIVRAGKSSTSMPSAATQADGTVYVLNSRIDTLFNKDAPKVSDFTLQQF